VYVHYHNARIAENMHLLQVKWAQVKGVDRAVEKVCFFNCCMARACVRESLRISHVTYIAYMCICMCVSKGLILLKRSVSFYCILCGVRDRQCRFLYVCSCVCGPTVFERRESYDRNSLLFPFIYGMCVCVCVCVRV